MKNLEKWLARDRAKVATDAKASSDDPSSMAEGKLIDELKEGALTFDCVPIEMRTPEVCLAAVEQQGHAIHYLTEVQRAPAVCLAAVRQNGRAIQHLTEAQRTPEVCLSAVQQDGWAINYLTEAQRTPDVCLAAVQQNGHAIKYLNDEQRTPDVCLAAVQEYGRNVSHLTPAQCAQPLISNWIEANWKDVAKLLGRDKAREVAQAILDARQADAEGAQDGYDSYERARG